MSQQSRYYPLGGGLDLVTPAISMPPGRAITAINYEATSNGYRRIDGYERFDGQPAPSKAIYVRLDYDGGTAPFAAEDIVTGLTSGATAEVIDVIGGTAAGTVVLGPVSGVFQDGEALQVGGATHGFADGAAAIGGADNDADDLAWSGAARALARGDILAVPGSGPVRGVWLYRGVAYAFRDSADGLRGNMWRATGGGWMPVDLGRRIAFTSGGAYEIGEGDTITGAMSGATAIVRRVVTRSGSWSAGDAEGYLVFLVDSGTFGSGETLNVGANTDVATMVGGVSDNHLGPGGRYDCLNHNFYGASDLERMYCAYGEGQAFEFDGAVFCPIATGNTVDKPYLVSIHKNHLFLAFRGGSAQHSATGEPRDFRAITGAVEIAMGQDITGFIADYAGILGILCRNKIAVLSGNDATDWVLAPLAEDAGAAPWSAQKVGTALYVDDAGIRDMATTQKFGDFTMGTVSRLIAPLMEAKRRQGDDVIASVRVRTKDQYRLFYAGGDGIAVYLGNKYPESTAFSLPVVARCACSGEDGRGGEVLLIGSDDGWVYRLDSGYDFDGAELPHFIRLAWNHVGSPTINKRWAKATLEADCGPNTQLGIIAEFSYADPDQPPSEWEGFAIQGGGAVWDEGNWDEFYWSAPAKDRISAPIDGFGSNASIAIVGEADWEVPHTLHGLTLHYSIRGLQR